MAKWLKKNKKGMANFLLLTVIMFITYYFLFQGEDKEEILEALGKADCFYLGLGVISAFLFIAFEAVIIKYLMKTLGKKVKFFSSLKYSMIGFFFSSVTPSASGGQPMQVMYMKRDGINVSDSSLILLIITVFYKFVIVFMGIIIMILSGDFLKEHIEAESTRYLFYFGLIANIIVTMAFFVIIFMKKISQILMDFLIGIIMRFKIFKNKNGIREKIENSFERYQKGAEYFKKNKLVLFNVFWITVLQRCFMFIVTYFIYKSFGLNEYDLIHIVMLQCVIAITIDILPFPGGAGISESCFMSIFLKLFKDYFILPAVVLYRGITYYLFLLISGIVLCVSHITGKRNTEDLR